MTGLEYNTALKVAKAKYQAGEITIDELYAAADVYIKFLRDYKKRTGKRLSIPSRAYLIRAV